MAPLSTLATLVAFAVPSSAHTIHSVLVFTRHGDRTAKFYKGYEMTALGAQQMYQSGQFYRDRYLTEEHPISGIARNQALDSQIWASAPDQHVLYQTATNFLQGLYPPLEEVEALNNSSSVSGPLNGYQYILVHGEDAHSSDTIWLKGDDSCPAYDSASKSYKQSQEYQSTLTDSAGFYSQFTDVLGPIMGTENVNYARAYDVFDLLNVASIHNRTIVNAPFDYEAFSVPGGEAALDQLRYYANEWEWHSNFNATLPERSVGGRTLAGGILNQMQSVVDNHARVKFSLMAGSYDTFLSFFGVANLQDANKNFMGLPNYAASMVFELFTEEAEFDVEQLQVRFLFKNGTDADQGLQAFPLFGGSSADMPWSEFVARMDDRAISTVGEWCDLCGSMEAFCVAANATAAAEGAAASVSGSSDSSSLSSAAAGGIGAAVALAVVGVVAAGLWLVRRKRARNAVGRQRIGADPEKSLSDSGSERL